MTDAHNKKTLNALIGLRKQHAKRLEGNPDFEAIEALDQAIARLQGRPAVNGIGGGRLSQSAAARKVILDTGKPVATKPLMEGIQHLGVKIGGKNPAGNLVSILSGSDEFESVNWGDGRAWWIAGRPQPKE